MSEPSSERLAEVLSGWPVLWGQPGAMSVPPGTPWVGWGADPRTTMTISWATPEAVREPAVEIGTDGHFGLTVLAETRTVPGWGVHYHHATVARLDPGTEYHYRCRHQGATGAVRTLRTAPAGPEPFTFAAYGDQGTCTRAEAVMGVLAAAAPTFTFCLGDLCYADPTGGVLAPGEVDHTAWDRWLGMASRATGAGGALLPVVGNHEIESGMGHWGYDGYLARFALPDTGSPGLPTTWTARWGNVGLVAADANDVSTEITRNNGLSEGLQDLWLNRALAGLRADPTIDWIVVGFHHSAYSTNSLHGSDAGVRRWAPLFDRWGVDLVVNGHNHCYERTHPVLAGAPVAEVRPGGAWWAGAGVTYLCAGGGGGQPFPMSMAAMSTLTVDGGRRIPERAPWSAFRYNDNSLVLVDVTPPDGAGTTTMTVRAVDSAGIELERFTLLRTNAGVPSAPPVPDPAGSVAAA